VALTVVDSNTCGLTKSSIFWCHKISSCVQDQLGAGLVDSQCATAFNESLDAHILAAHLDTVKKRCKFGVGWLNSRVKIKLSSYYFHIWSEAGRIFQRSGKRGAASPTLTEVGQFPQLWSGLNVAYTTKFLESFHQSCLLRASECTKFVLRRGSASDHAGSSQFQNYARALRSLDL